jgi:hypothetical protein
VSVTGLAILVVAVLPVMSGADEAPDRPQVDVDQTLAQWPQPRTFKCPLTEDQRWQQLRYLNQDAAALEIRVAGALILLFGLPASRLGLITAEHIQRRGGDTSLNIGRRPPLMPTRLSDVWPPEQDSSRIAAQVVGGLVAEGEAMRPDEAYEYALAGLSGYLPEIDVRGWLEPAPGAC